jgi:hypothetical protein
VRGVRSIGVAALDYPAGGLVKYAARRDNNEPEVIAALEGAGASVQQLAPPLPDLLVSWRGTLHLLEVKNPAAKGGGKYNTGDGSLTSSQTRWWAGWRGKPPVIVHNAGEALAAIGASGGVV